MSRAVKRFEQSSVMPKSPRKRFEPMEHLAAWRLSAGLSRQCVVDRIAFLFPHLSPIDQATLGKWESGETAVRVQDLRLLAEVYGIGPDRLFFPPGDKRTPELLQRAMSVISAATPDTVERWLALGESLPRGPVEISAVSSENR